MNGVDIIGAESIMQFMDSAKKTKFSIYRYGQSSNSLPVFESLEHETYKNAIQDFKAWSDIIKNNSIYKMVLFDIVELGMDQTITKKVKGKAGKLEIFFQLHPGAVQNLQNPVNTNISAPVQNYDLSSIKAEIVREITQKAEESAILKSLDAINARLTTLEGDDDDDDDDDGLSGDKLANILKVAGMLFPGNAANQQPPVINGIEPETEKTTVSNREQKMQVLNSAIKRLYKINPNLETDLSLLADLAETDQQTFNFLIETLRNR